jgi:hypothetical protein
MVAAASSKLRAFRIDYQVVTPGVFHISGKKPLDKFRALPSK